MRPGALSRWVFKENLKNDHFWGEPPHRHPLGLPYVCWPCTPHCCWVPAQQATASISGAGEATGAARRDSWGSLEPWREPIGPHRQTAIRKAGRGERGNTPLQRGACLLALALSPLLPPTARKPSRKISSGEVFGALGRCLLVAVVFREFHLGAFCLDVRTLTFCQRMDLSISPLKGKL